MASQEEEEAALIFEFTAPASYLKRAGEFWKAYLALSDLHAPDGISWPRYFLFTHTVELALRAYLMASGVPHAELKHHPLNHSIERLMAMSLERGLDASVNDLRLLDQAHREFVPRYPQKYAVQVFTSEQFEGMVEHLICVVGGKVYGAP